MNKVKVVTDSTAYLPQILIKEYGIIVVPLMVNFPDESFPENREDDFHSFFEKLCRSKKLPTTSQPPAGKFYEAFNRLSADGSSVISIHISGKLSGTVQSARTAAAMLPDRDITVVDSLFTVSSLLYLVREAVEMSRLGKGKAEIIKRIDFMKNHSRLFFLVDSLEFLHRGGRIGGGAAVFGTLLQIKPILHLDNGSIELFQKVRTKERAVARIIDEVGLFIEGHDPAKLKLGVIHVDNPTGIEVFKKSLSQRWPEMEFEEFAVGPVIGSHVGPGSIGISIARVD